MDKQILFEDEHIRVILLPGNSSELVLSFGDLITRAKGLSINAEKSLMKYEYNAIGIMPKQKSWFPATSMAEMATTIAPILARFQRIVGYGGSMGGYAAIKYSKLLQMDRVVAFVPQYSIDPDEVTDIRYTEFYQEDVNKDMRIQGDDIHPEAEYIVVYDPYFDQDREHYEKIKAVIPDIYTLHLPFTGHEALSVLASSSLLNDFIRHPFDAPYFYKQMREVKKNSKFYYRNVIANFLPAHSKALGRILKHNNLQLDDQYLDANLKQLITRTLLSKRQVTEQDLQKLGIKVNLPQDNRNQLQDYFGNTLVFNLISQKLESYPQAAIDLNYKYLIPLQAESSGLAKIDVNQERYLIVMNDRRVMRLINDEDALSTDMNPIVVKKYPDFYVLSYKDLNVRSSEHGICSFVESPVQDTEKFRVV